MEPFKVVQNYEALKENKKNMKLEEISEAIRGNSTIIKFRMSLLNFFAYLSNIPCLVVLSSIILEENLEILIFEDSFGRDLLDIGIEKGFDDLLGLIISLLSKARPKFGSWPGFNLNKIIRLLDLRMPEVGNLLDSRLFKIDLPEELIFSHTFNLPKSRFYEGFPLNHAISDIYTSQVFEHFINHKFYAYV